MNPLITVLMNHLSAFALGDISEGLMSKARENNQSEHNSHPANHPFGHIPGFDFLNPEEEESIEDPTVYDNLQKKWHSLTRYKKLETLASHKDYVVFNMALFTRPVKLELFYSEKDYTGLASMADFTVSFARFTVIGSSLVPADNCKASCNKCGAIPIPCFPARVALSVVSKCMPCFLSKARIHISTKMAPGKDMFCWLDKNKVESLIGQKKFFFVTIKEAASSVAPPTSSTGPDQQFNGKIRYKSEIFSKEFILKNPHYDLEAKLLKKRAKMAAKEEAAAAAKRKKAGIPPTPNSENLTDPSGFNPPAHPQMQLNMPVSIPVDKSARQFQGPSNNYYNRNAQVQNQNYNQNYNNNRNTQNTNNNNNTNNNKNTQNNNQNSNTRSINNSQGNTENNPEISAAVDSSPTKMSFLDKFRSYRNNPKFWLIFGISAAVVLIIVGLIIYKCL